MITHRPQVPPRQNRAQDFVNALKIRFAVMKAELKPDQGICISCSVGERFYDVRLVGVMNEDFVMFTAENGDGNLCQICVAVEQTAVLISLFTRTKDEKPREIGFKAEMEAERH